MKKIKKLKPADFGAVRGGGVISQLLELTWAVPLPKVFPRISVNFISAIMGTTGGLGLLLYYIFFSHEILRLGGWLLLSGALLVNLLRGENARRFLDFVVPVRTLRKAGVVTDDYVCSTTFTRAIVYRLLAAEIAYQVWFWVLNTQPIYGLTGIEDPLQINLTRFYHATDQLLFYWWLLPVLFILAVGFVKKLDTVPGIRVVMRQTRIVMMFLIPLVAYFQISGGIRWVRYHFFP